MVFTVRGERVSFSEEDKDADDDENGEKALEATEMPSTLEKEGKLDQNEKDSGL